MKLHGFHGNPCDFREWGCFYKNTHISAATHPRTLNLVTSLFEDIAVVLAGWICKLSYLNIHEFRENISKKGMKNCGKIKVVYLQNYLYLS